MRVMRDDACVHTEPFFERGPVERNQCADVNLVVEVREASV